MVFCSEEMFMVFFGLPNLSEGSISFEPGFLQWNLSCGKSCPTSVKRVSNLFICCLWWAGTFKGTLVSLGPPSMWLKCLVLMAFWDFYTCNSASTRFEAVCKSREMAWFQGAVRWTLCLLDEVGGSLFRMWSSGHLCGEHGLWGVFRIFRGFDPMALGQKYLFLFCRIWY